MAGVDCGGVVISGVYVLCGFRNFTAIFHGQIVCKNVARIHRSGGSGVVDSDAVDAMGIRTEVTELSSYRVTEFACLQKIFVAWIGEWGTWVGF